jgi:ketosteroid isomerase-like protein
MSTPGMTDDDRRHVTIEYFKRFDAGKDVLDLFADDAYVYFPKHRPARNLEEVRQLFGDVGSLFASIVHEVPYFNHIVQGERVVVEGTTYGALAHGQEWRAGQGLGGRFCNVFEVRDDKIQRLHIYLDPDYADQDTARYPWLDNAAQR